MRDSSCSNRAGIGEHLGLTLLYEIGDIKGFPTVKDFLSYCSLVKGTVASAGKLRACAVPTGQRLCSKRKGKRPKLKQFEIPPDMPAIQKSEAGNQFCKSRGNETQTNFPLPILK